MSCSRSCLLKTNPTTLSVVSRQLFMGLVPLPPFTRYVSGSSTHCLLPLGPQPVLCFPDCSDDSHFNVSLIVLDKVTRPCPQTTTFDWRQCSDRYIYSPSVFPHLHTPSPHSPRQSLINLMVSVDVRHHVYLLTNICQPPPPPSRFTTK